MAASRTALSCAVLALAGGAAQAVTVNLSRFPYPPIDVVMQGPAESYTGEAGQFEGTLLDGGTVLSSSADARARVLVIGASPTSFLSYCAEITQAIQFNTPYEFQRVEGAARFGAAKADDLSRLFTAAASFVVDGSTSAAFQSALWEIVYEHDDVYDLAGGLFTGAPVNPADAGSAAAFAQINLFLANLSSYAPLYHVEALTNQNVQDLLFATPLAAVPEPQTWSLLLVGLAAAGWVARRRRTPAAGS